MLLTRSVRSGACVVHSPTASHPFNSRPTAAPSLAEGFRVVPTSRAVVQKYSQTIYWQISICKVTRLLLRHHKKSSLIGQSLINSSQIEICRARP